MEAQVKALSKEITSAFIKNRHAFSELGEVEIIQLKKAVLTESYYLSSLKLAVFRNQGKTNQRGKAFMSALQKLQTRTD